MKEIVLKVSDLTQEFMVIKTPHYVFYNGCAYICDEMKISQAEGYKNNKVMIIYFYQDSIKIGYVVIQSDITIQFDSENRMTSIFNKI